MAADGCRNTILTAELQRAGRQGTAPQVVSLSAAPLEIG